MPVQSHSVLPTPVRIEAAGATLNGDLSLPPDAFGLAVFAHGSRSSRHSSRNRVVADALQRAQLATLMLDLLTESEERVDVVTAEFRFDIPLLADRVIAAVDWARAAPATSSLSIGTFGASTGAAAALIAAAERPEAVRTVVSRGGRPDLAASALDRVVAPTLLIVGGRDPVVIELNQAAFARLKAQGAEDRARRDASVRGAGNARRRDAAGARVVRPVPRLNPAFAAIGPACVDRAAQSSRTISTASKVGAGSAGDMNSQRSRSR